jgi:4-hydroxybenzoate polyprenyltransferase
VPTIASDSRHLGGGVRRLGEAPLLRRYLQFGLERFAPLLHLPLIAALVGPIYIASWTAGGGDVTTVAVWPVIVSGVVVAMALFAMRAYDDAKDAVADQVGRPDRPVPRGVVSAGELRGLASGCLALGAIVTLALSPPATIAYLGAAAFLWLAGRDFMAPRLVHRDLLIYALVHAPALPLLAIFVWWSNPTAGWHPSLAALMVMTAGATLCLEVSRKTRAPEQERPSVETYSGAYGVGNAMALAATALAISALAAGWYAVFVPSTGLAVAVAVPSLAGLVAAAVLALRRRLGITAFRSLVSGTALLLILSPLVVALR